MASFGPGRLGLLNPSQEKEMFWEGAFRMSQRKLHFLEYGVDEEALERCNCVEEFEQRGSTPLQATNTDPRAGKSVVEDMSSHFNPWPHKK